MATGMPRLMRQMTSGDDETPTGVGPGEEPVLLRQMTPGTPQPNSLRQPSVFDSVTLSESLVMTADMGDTESVVEDLDFDWWRAVAAHKETGENAALVTFEDGATWELKLRAPVQLPPKAEVEEGAEAAPEDAPTMKTFSFTATHNPAPATGGAAAASSTAFIAEHTIVLVSDLPPPLVPVEEDDDDDDEEEEEEEKGEERTRVEWSVSLAGGGGGGAAPAGVVEALAAQLRASLADLRSTLSMRAVNWVPLESNPEMLTSFAHSVGMPEGCGFAFQDVYGLDPELLLMVPKPVLAVTLLFNFPALREHKAAQRARIEAAGQSVDGSLFYMRQYVGNACGTIATLHALANNMEQLGIDAGDSPLGRFVASTAAQGADQRGLALAAASELHEKSEGAATDEALAQTEAPEADASVDHHFIAFVEVGGDLYELDGAKAFAVNHGPTDGDTLAKAAAVIRSCFFEPSGRDDFNLMALAPPPQWD